MIHLETDFAQGYTHNLSCDPIEDVTVNYVLLTSCMNGFVCSDV